MTLIRRSLDLVLALIRDNRSRIPELRTLAGITLVFASVWTVIEIAEEAGHGRGRNLDRALLLAMRNPSDLSDPIGPRWLEETVRDFTALGAVGPLTFAVASILGYLWLIQRRKTALMVLLAETGGIGFNQLLKGYFARPRPELVPHQVYSLGESFPSGHSMMAAITYLTLAALLVSTDTPVRHRLYLLTCALMLTMLIGLSRIYLGVHWPTDVLAGWTAGAGWATAWWLIARRVGAR